ncbi:MAG: ABC transporter substrate-binding protein [Gracilimonas sp.]|uniref:ABC transporter substrate-binding protein n=1 Tax=Gracilimonas sp. TaxID=1974203 RepID=UPI0019B4D168|nr:ABC transporter substrate-binding protein [Gracilimonas sp.]MBD3617379.1 ABC transporter substrate-binding protein [Gracilimonas sp.]
MKKLFLFLLPFFLVISCGKGPETVTIQSDPSDLFTAPDTSNAEVDTSDEEFVHVKLGEIAAIESLDPLFSFSNSEWRIINLIYQGLVEIGENGTLIPGLAKSWDINDDSTQFTFYLKTDVYFHDSPVFESATGRRFVAQDVKYIFERMAHNNVPDFTADHFEDIHGFSAFHNEQTYVKNPSRRVLNTVDGVQVRNDSTVSFIMNRSAPDFLTRLAHPMASIYPKEIVSSANDPIQQAVGTGAFRFVSKEGNAHLLTPNDDYSKDIPAINRLDIISGLTERDLFQEFARNNLDALIELGPSTLLTVADSTGNLLQSYYENYTLDQTSVSAKYQLYYNENSGQSRQVSHLISSIDPQSLLTNKIIGTVSVSEVDTAIAKNIDKTQLIVTQTTHPLEIFFLNNLAPKANELGYTFAMNASYAISNEITFSTKPFPGTQPFLTWETPIFILSHSSITGVTVRHKPWLLDLSSIQLKQDN